MSDEHEAGSDAPAGQPDYNKLLLNAREAWASGQLGDPNSERVRTELAKLDAQIALRRKTGEMEPAPVYDEAWAAGEQLKREFPFDPTKPFSEFLATSIEDKLTALGNQTAEKLGRLAADVVADIEANPSRTASRPYDPEKGARPSAAATVNRLVEDAAVALRRTIADPQRLAAALKLLRCDRQLLELHAATGQAQRRYAERRRELGLKD